MASWRLCCSDAAILSACGLRGVLLLRQNIQEVIQLPPCRSVLMSAMSLSVAAVTRSRSPRTASIAVGELTTVAGWALSVPLCACAEGADRIKVKEESAIAARTFFIADSFGGPLSIAASARLESITDGQGLAGLGVFFLCFFRPIGRCGLCKMCQREDNKGEHSRLPNAPLQDSKLR